MSPRKKRRSRQKKGTPPVVRGTSARVSDQDWSRKGAANIAGVSFQVAVTAQLLVGSALGNGLPVSRAIPEGFEDIDISLRDDARVFVQAKERKLSARFVPSELADAIRKKKELLKEDRACRFALVTNAMLGGNLAPTGWSRTVTECLDQTVIDKLAAHLEREIDDPVEVLARTHIVQVERNVDTRTRRGIAEFQLVGNQPSVATLVYARLVEHITEISVRQRSTTPETAQSITPSDLEVLVKQVVEAVDVHSLDEAIRDGIVEPVDFSVQADLSTEEFLAGVDVMPTHIAADLDLPRLSEVQALTDGLAEQRSALLAGPSGSGKSALMWRTARELSGRTRPYRLLSLLPEDLPKLRRWLRLQEPSEHYPLLLCADNLGRPDTAGWSEFAREFIDRPGVLLLGACREEDYRPGLAVGRTTIVDPILNRKLAEGIANSLSDRGVQTVVDVAEAFTAAEGLLMEFLSMLLTGRRLQQVIEEQVDIRLQEDRRTEREILRYVATAHAAGVAIPADALELLLAGHDLAPAVAVLHREHLIVTDDGNRLRGLHELRSAVARDYLHLFPLPAMATTVRRLVEHLPVEDACQMIEAYARFDVDLKPAAEAVSGILHLPGIRARDGSRLMSSLAMADAFRHAHACLEVVEDHRPSTIEPYSVLLFTYAPRFVGISFDTVFAKHPGLVQALKEIANALPPRPPSLRGMCLQDVSVEAVVDIALRGTAVEAAAWLESLEDSLVGCTVPVQEVWTHFSGVPLDTGARLYATLSMLATAEDKNHLDGMLGPLQDRIQRLAIELPDCIAAETKDEPDGRVVSLCLVAPEDDSTLNERSVQTCRVILDLCPEADIAEVVVVTPGGDRYVVGDMEEGHKCIPRSNLPRATQTDGNANFLRAARLLLAARYWTQPLRTIAAVSRQLIKFRKDAVAWLFAPKHHTSRRHKAVETINSLVVELAGLPGETVGQDDSSRGSNARQALTDALTAIRDLASIESFDDLKNVQLAARCRLVVESLMEARQGDLPILSTIGDPLPCELDDMLKLLANLLLIRAEGHKVTYKQLRRRSLQAWWDVAHRLVHEAASNGYQIERSALEHALGTVNSLEIHKVEHTDLGSPRFLTDRWVVIIPAESEDTTPMALVENLAPELAERLAFRTFLVLGSNKRILPFGCCKLGTSRIWPAEEEELLTIATGLGTEVVNSPHLKAWDVFVEELVRASRAATLMRLRENADLKPDYEAFQSRYESARKAAEVCHPELRAGATKLLERVGNEPSGFGPTLAGEYYRSVTHGEQSGDWITMVALRVAAQSIDL